MIGIGGVCLERLPLDMMDVRSYSSRRVAAYVVRPPRLTLRAGRRAGLRQGIAAKRPDALTCPAINLTAQSRSDPGRFGMRLAI